MNDIKVGQIWENKHLFNDAYDVVVCWVNDGFVWSHYTDDDDLVKESQSDFLRLRRLKSDPYFLNDNQKIVLEWLEEYYAKSQWPFPFYVLKHAANDMPANIFGFYDDFTMKEEFEVLTAFAQWGLEQEDVE